MKITPYDLTKVPHERLEKRLVASGRHARAEVLQASLPVTYTTSGITFDDNMIVPWDLELHVTPDTEPEFDVRLRMHIHNLLTLSPGIVFQVLYDPEDHQKMVADPSALPKTTVEGSIMYELGSMSARGIDTTGMQDVVNSATLEAAQEIIHRRVSEQVAARNNTAMAETLKARREGTHTAPPPAGFAPDVSSRLEQLDRLKKAGLIDEQQYETKKQRLIDQL